ncbi:MAG: hypothetical protein QG623_529 [Patescibacteria group bacterium]|nr:hypothetical protein [Patescibacteria group bacterium]
MKKNILKNTRTKFTLTLIFIVVISSIVMLSSNSTKDADTKRSQEINTVYTDTSPRIGGTCGYSLLDSKGELIEGDKTCIQDSTAKAALSILAEQDNKTIKSNPPDSTFMIIRGQFETYKEDRAPATPPPREYKEHTIIKAIKIDSVELIRK